MAVRFRSACAFGELADAVVPVPLHAARLRERGYNQAGLLAEAGLQRVDSSIDAYGIFTVTLTRKVG